jgi:hypothetical protein
MHWPKNSLIQRIDSKDAVIILRHGCQLNVKHFQSDGLQELLRSTLVLGVSALDRYMHERIVKRIIVAMRSKNLSREQTEFSIPASTAIQVAHSVDKLEAIAA